MKFSGRVLDQHDRTPLSFAEVRIAELQRSEEADERGVFLFEGLCPGRYAVTVAHLGCEPLTVQVELREDLERDLFLEHHAAELTALDVQRNRPDENVGQAQVELDADAMERSSGLALGDMLATIPGVNTLQSGPTISKPVIHGLSGNRVLILNQGIRQEDQQWGSEHAPNLDPLSSDRVTVVKGAAGVQYGSDAIGGVVITEPVELPREAGLAGEVRGFGQWNGKGGGGNAMLQGGVRGMRGFGWRLQGSGRYIGDSEAPDYTLSNTGVRDAGFSGSMGYRDHRWSTGIYYSWFTRRNGILRASHIGNLTDLNNAIASGEPWYVAEPTYEIAPPSQEVRHQLVKAEAGYAVSDRNRLLATYGYQADERQEYDVRRGGRSGVAALDLSLVTHTADVALNHWLGPHVHGKLGISGVHQENSNIPGTGIRPLIPDYRKRVAGAYVLEHFPLADGLELEAGARLERAELDVAKYDASGELIRPVHDFTNGAMSAGLNWGLRDSIDLRFNVSTAYRPPNVSELYSEGLHHGAAAIEVGDPGLGSERTLKAVVDLGGFLCEGRLRLDATVHAARIDGFIYLRPDGTRLTIRGAFPVYQYTATNAQLIGGDLSARYRFSTRWEWSLRASTVHARDLVLDEWLFRMPSDRVENTLTFFMPTTGKWRGLQVSLSSLVVLEQERIPEGVDFMPPPDTYHLLGAGMQAVRSLGTNELRLGLRGFDLLNASYRDYMDAFRYYADARGLDLTFWITYAFGTGDPVGNDGSRN